MNRRNLYFWLDRLKINPAERKAVSFLLVLFVGLAVINTLLRPASPFEESYYADLEQVFQQKASLLKKKEEKLLARYEPELPKQLSVSITPDTVGGDSLEKINTPKDSDQVASHRININTADAGRLETLPGIGPVYARRIIDYRTGNGLFSSMEELLQIKGIGKKRLEKLKPFIKLKGSTEN